MTTKGVAIFFLLLLGNFTYSQTYFDACLDVGFNENQKHKVYGRSWNGDNHFAQLKAQNTFKHFSVGPFSSISGIVSTMSSADISPYHNAWGYTYAHGIKGCYYNSNRLIVSLAISKGELINSYNIDKHDALFSAKDIKKNSNLDNFKWKSYSAEAGFGYKVLDGRFSCYIGGGLSVNWGHLSIENFPYPNRFVSPVLKKEVYFQDGERGVVIYQFEQESVVEPAISIITTVGSSYKLSNKFDVSIDLSWLSGLTPMVGSKIYYEIESKSTKDTFSTFSGEYYSFSSNSGYRISLSAQYNLSPRSKRKSNIN